MGEYTLLKLQFEDSTFTANAPFSGAGGSDSGTDDDTDTEGGDGSESDDGGSQLVPLLVGLAFLVLVAVVVKKLRGGTGQGGSEDTNDDPSKGNTLSNPS